MGVTLLQLQLIIAGLAVRTSFSTVWDKLLWIEQVKQSDCKICIKCQVQISLCTAFTSCIYTQPAYTVYSTLVCVVLADILHLLTPSLCWDTNMRTGTWWFHWLQGMPIYTSKWVLFSLANMLVCASEAEVLNWFCLSQTKLHIWKCRGWSRFTALFCRPFFLFWLEWWDLLTSWWYSQMYEHVFMCLKTGDLLLVIKLYVTITQTSRHCANIAHEAADMKEPLRFYNLP